jgi:hypothetical protein
MGRRIQKKLIIGSVFFLNMDGFFYYYSRYNHRGR